MRKRSCLSCASRRRRCEASRRLTPEVMDALDSTGLLRYLQPKAWGGMELPFVSYYDIPEMLSRGDISVGWVVANLGSHHRNLAWYEARAQEEVWGENPDAGIASGIAFQQGRGVPAEGGVVLSGEWNFSSGQDHSDWSVLACIVRDGDKPIDYMLCLLHRTQYEVIDDWYTLGMRATSSKTVRCKDVFVPAYRALSMYLAKPGGLQWPGVEIHRNPHYRIPTSAIGGHCIGACLVGNARNALETTIDLVKSRSTNYTGAEDARFPDGATAHRIGGREDRCRRPRPAQRLSGSSAHGGSRRVAPARDAASIQAQLRHGCADVRRSGRLAARDGRRERHLRSLSAPAHVAGPALGVPGTSISASMRSFRAGRFTRSAESSRARRCDVVTG